MEQQVREVAAKIATMLAGYSCRLSHCILERSAYNARVLFTIEGGRDDAYRSHVLIELVKGLAPQIEVESGDYEWLDDETLWTMMTANRESLPAWASSEGA